MVGAQRKIAVAEIKETAGQQAQGAKDKIHHTCVRSRIVPFIVTLPFVIFRNFFRCLYCEGC
jgi:hypothetical protein